MSAWRYIGRECERDGRERERSAGTCTITVVTYSVSVSFAIGVGHGYLARISERLQCGRRGEGKSKGAVLPL